MPAKGKYKPFIEARQFIHDLKLKNQKEWRKYHKSDRRPSDIPSAPSDVYKNEGWRGYGDWLGTYVIAGRLKKYRSFEEARNFVLSLKLECQNEWFNYCKSGKRPEDIPRNPSQFYKNKGWKGYGDWLGTDRIATRFLVYRSFEDARKYVHSIKLNGQIEWFKYSKSSKKPSDIPARPDATYKNKGWISWGDWLGTYSVSDNLRVYRIFEEAREFVRGLKLKGQTGWKKYCKSGNKPEDIPAKPNVTYKDKGWISFGDWFGTGSVAPRLMVYRSFEEARNFVHSLNLKNVEEWKEYCKSGKKSDDIPATPNNTYKNKGWKSYGDWLGSGRISNQEKYFRSFEEARNFARSLNLKGIKEWREYCKTSNKPNDIPSAPDQAYRNDGWKGIGDWLGTYNLSPSEKSKLYPPFEEFVKILRKEGISSSSEYRKWWNKTKPKNMPVSPEQTYGKYV